MPAARADIGTSECPVMPGEVFISSRKGLRSLARTHQVGAAPAAAAQRAVGRPARGAGPRASSAARQAARAEVAGVVGEVLVLVVVVAVGRDDADHRQRRARRRPAPSTGQVSSSPSMNSSHSTSRVVLRGQRHRVLHLRIAQHLGDADRRALARRLDDQRQAERVGHRRARARAPARRAPARPSAASAGPRPAQTRLVITLSMAMAEAITPEPV